MGSGARWTNAERVARGRPPKRRVPGKRKRKVLERDGYVCQVKLPGCTQVATTVDRIIPRARGGSRRQDNLQAACESCNQRKSDS